MKRNTNPIVSIYRSSQTINALHRIHVVTGTEFPVSGDAPLRATFERRTPNELARYDAFQLSQGLLNSTERPC